MGPWPTVTNITHPQYTHKQQELVARRSREKDRQDKNKKKIDQTKTNRPDKNQKADQTGWGLQIL